MVGIYKIINTEKGTEATFNELAILKTIKLCEQRSPTVTEYYIQLYEKLEKEKFTKKKLEFI